MEFPPFWKLLEQMGIELPEPSRLKKPPPTRQTNSQTRSQTRRSRRRPTSEDGMPDEMIDLLGALQMMAALEELASLSEGESRQMRSAAAPQPERVCWVPFGETVEVGDYEIPGMVYVGGNLANLRRNGAEPSLIRPALNISRRRPDYTKTPAAYNPSYTQMRDGDRAAYLAWLAGGRCDPKAHSSYVWLFYYGLERRLLHDLLKQPQDESWQTEVRQIAVEIRRLKKLYGNPVANWSFDHKSTALLEICELLLSSGASAQPVDLEKAPLLSLQVGLGRLVQQKQPLSAAWALAWYSKLANNPLPTAAQRCPAEFKTLFELRYHQQYGDGMLVKPGKAKLTVSYFPASPSFGRTVDVPVGDLPDLSRFTAKLNKIAELIYDCRMELEPLSRLMGRNAQARGTAAAVALLPPDLLQPHGGSVLKSLKRWLEQKFAAAELPVISGQELLKHWSGSQPDKLTNSEAQNLSKLLMHLGYGFEPDPRFGGALPNAKSSFALFPWPAKHPDSLSLAYTDATLQVQMALAVASGDGAASLLERQSLERQIARFPELSPPERLRLQAYMQVLIQQTPALRNLKTRIERMHPEHRAAVPQLLLHVAAADGPITPEEVKLLEKAYRLLELDPQQLYSDVHDHSTLPDLARGLASEPVTVQPASPSKGHKIPARPKAGLDMNLVQSKIAESQEISGLLANIFTEADPQPAAKPAPPKAAKAKRAKAKQAETALIVGLDAAHSQLLRALAQQKIWLRQDLVDLASQLDLMLDGALEVINELAFERIDQPVTEGEDEIEVDQTVLQELLG